MVLGDEKYTTTKPIACVVEEQEVQQFSDGIDGPSIFTDPAVSLATLILFRWFKLCFGIV